MNANNLDEAAAKLLDLRKRRELGEIDKLNRDLFDPKYHGWLRAAKVGAPPSRIHVDELIRQFLREPEDRPTGVAMQLFLHLAELKTKRNPTFTGKPPDSVEVEAAIDSVTAAKEFADLPRILVRDAWLEVFAPPTEGPDAARRDDGIFGKPLALCGLLVDKETDDGFCANLEFQTVRRTNRTDPPQLYASSRMAFVTFAKEFADAERAAGKLLEQNVPPDSYGFDVRWTLTRYDDIPLPRFLGGPSLGLALTIGALKVAAEGGNHRGR